MSLDHLEALLRQAQQDAKDCAHPPQSQRRGGFNGGAVGDKTEMLEWVCLLCGADLPIRNPK